MSTASLRFVASTILLSAALFLSGCDSMLSNTAAARVVSGVRLSPEAASFIAPGETTRQQVMDEFKTVNGGKPQWNWPNGMAYLWSTSSSTMTGFFGKPTSWQPQTDHAFAVAFEDHAESGSQRVARSRFFLASGEDQLRSKIEEWLRSK